MSASNEWTEWHLTPRGWEEGTCKTDFKLTEVSPPEDRVLTTRYWEFLSSRYSEADIGSKEIWRCQNDDQITALLTEFGPCPNRI